MSDVLSFPKRTYSAKQFHAAGFQTAGTLDGYIDFAVPAKGTFQLSLAEADQLIAALSGAVADVRANCLYDKDVLLEPRK